MTKSIAIQNRIGERIHPCLTPVFTLNGSVGSPSTRTVHSESSYRLDIILMIFLGIPYTLKMFHNAFLSTLSKAFWKSTKFRMIGDCHSLHCSKTFLNANIWSVHDRPGLNPACSYLSFSSIAFRIHPRMMEQDTFPGTDRRVMPLQLLQSVRSPFFGIFMIVPFFQSLGISSSIQMLL